MIRALIFDLDDTLYCEREFVASGYRSLAERACAECGRPSPEIFEFMMETFTREGRILVLPRVIERFNLSVRLEDLVAAYRTHTPEIRLYAGYEGLLREFRKKYRIGIVTDGIPEVQQRKCRALGLAGAVDSIVCTWEYGKEKEKPHPHSFRLILGSLRVQPAEALFIGDSMEKDCRGAHDAGMKCALVARQPGVRSVPGAGEADFVIGSLFQLPQVLRQLEDRNEAA